MATMSAVLVSMVIWIVCCVSVVPFLTAVYSYRFLLSKIVPFLNSKIYKIVTTTSAIYLSNDEAKRVRLGVMFGLEGDIRLEDLRSTFLTQVVDATDSERRLLRPELRQFLVHIGGYAFWKWEENFDIKEHIHDLDIDPGWFEVKRTGQQVLDMVEEKVLRRPWVKGNSPWELLLVHNFVDNPTFGFGIESSYRGSLVILHMSHALGDGSTISGLCEGVFGDSNLIKVLGSKGHDPKQKSINTDQGMTFGFREAFRTYFFGLRNSIWASKDQQRGNEVIPVKPPMHKHRFYMSVTPIIPLDVVKKIRRSQGVSFTAVLVTLIAKAYVKLLRNAGSQPPQLLPCFAIRGFPRKVLVAMRNDMALVQCQVPLQSCAENGPQMFKDVESSIAKDLVSTNPRFTAFGIKLAGMLWTSLREMGGTFPKISPDRALMGFTNVAVTTKDLRFKGVNRLRTVFGIALTRTDGHGIICLTSSSNDAVRLVFQLGNETVPETFLDPELFTKFFLEELEYWSCAESFV